MYPLAHKCLPQNCFLRLVYSCIRWTFKSYLRGYYFYNFSSLALRRWHDFSLSSLRLKGEGCYIPEGDINFITENVSEAYKKAIKEGASKISPPKQVPWGQIVSQVKDNNGIVVEIGSPIGGY